MSTSLGENIPARLLNVGCGSIFHPDWINLDKYSFSPHVISHDVCKPLPFENASVDVVYSSHLIEHLSQPKAAVLLRDIYRVLRPSGVIRLVTPDLEAIVRLYLEKLNDVMGDKELAVEEYRWMLLELLDQLVREQRGGTTGSFLRAADPRIREFIRSRVGMEAEAYWETTDSPVSFWRRLRRAHPRVLVQHARNLLAKPLVYVIAGRDAVDAFEKGIFRMSGEVHLWLYDRYSLAQLMASAGFVEIAVSSPFQSTIPHFNDFGLDTINGCIRKPDSLFIEGVKP